MLPPEKIKKKPSQQSTGEAQAPATSTKGRDALRPSFCSKNDSNFGRGELTAEINLVFSKHFHRSSRITVQNPAAAARLIRDRVSCNQEELWVIALSAAKRIVGIDMVFRGTVDSCMVHPRDIIRFVCETNASSYIVAHNHPSGELEPSDQDWSFTRRLVACGELLDIPLIDHIVVTNRGHTSMARRKPGLFKQSILETNDPWMDLKIPDDEKKNRGRSG